VYFCTTKGTKSHEGCFSNSCQPSAVSYQPETANHQSKSVLICG
jgi:hypothetical protein